MTTDLLFKNFHLLADTPGGVKKLRELILQLAVKGRLVPQNPEDEPASVLLERIKEEKKRLIREGKIKKQKPLPEIKPEEMPYELPEGWEWTCFDEVGIVNPRNHLADELEVSFIPMASISDQYGIPVKYERGVWGKLKQGYTHLAENDIVLAKITPCFQNKKSAVMKGLLNHCGAGTTELHVIRPINNLLIPDYALLFLKSPIFISEGIPKMTGSAGQKRVPRDYFARTPFPFPPLTEQQRIVSKVDQLMALCDELEAKKEKQQSIHTRLNKSALHTLTESKTKDELSSNWTRIKDNFNLLFTTPESIQELRSSILQLAVQGRLVHQNPEEEPASVLLEKIREEKKRLIKEGKIKMQKTLPEIKLEEMPYDLPPGWEWVRLGIIVDKIHYGYTASADHDLTTPKMLRITDIQDNRVDWESVPGCQIDQANLNRYALQNGDILIARTGGTIGKSFLVPTIDVDAVFASYLIRIVPGKVCFPRFIKTFFESPTYWDQLYEKSMGTGQPNVNGTALGLLIVPFPSLPEQHRIVAKVDQLMALCDELEASLARAQADGQKLMQSVMAGMSGQNMMKDSMSMVNTNNRLLTSSGCSG